MEKRDLKISFFKGGSGSISAKTSIPKKWLDILKISQDERDIELILDEKREEIIIKKKK
ncbi:MAG: AbrB/MazE/SpoVT family DNA-binding domain-containing protein [Fusobacteriaceae bacterium]